MSERIIISKYGYGKTAKLYEDLIKETIDEKDKEIEELKNENEMLQDKVYKLEDIIGEAIEYIEDNTYKANVTEYMDLTGIKELLEILRGDKE